MQLLWLVIGIALPSVVGWLLLSFLEGHTPVLSQAERWVLGFLLGLTTTVFAAFAANVTVGIPFTLWGFLLVHAILLLIFGIPFLLRRPVSAPSASVSLRTSFMREPLWMRIGIAVLLLWTLVKIIGGAVSLAGSPAYLDDTISNWNLRGKLYFETHKLTLVLPTQPDNSAPSGISSYPPAVPLAKTWLTTLNGNWNEGLANSVHLLWFIAALALVFLLLLRITSAGWAAFGVYLLASLPLYMVQGTNAYADVFVSAHILAAVSLLFLAVREQDLHRRLSFLRLCAFASALLPFTKNEGFGIYLPILLVLIAATLVWFRKTHRMNSREMWKTIAWFAGFLLLVCVPWIGFKWLHGLPFGNAKSVSGLAIGWQKGVVTAIWINTFFEGNWLLFFPVLIGLVIARWRSAFRSSLVILSGFAFIVYFSQIPLFLFTSLSNEALLQTGYARGLIHLVPVLVVLVTVLLSQMMGSRGHHPERA